MKTTTEKASDSAEPKRIALHYMETLVDVARESFLILDPELRVILANPTFYETFRVLPKQTEKVLLYELGNGQWDIPLLKSLLEEVLPEKKDVRNYEVQHTFQTIGKKTMLLNARQIDSEQLIVLAMEDISARKVLEEKLAEYTKGLEAIVAKRTEELTDRVKQLETMNTSMVGRELKMVELKKEIEILKKKNHNGKNGNKKNTSRKTI